MLKFFSAAAAAAEAEELTFAEIMSEGFSTLLVGLGTVFAVLIVLWAAIALMGRVIGAANKKSAPAVPKAAPAPVPAPVPAPAPVAPAPVVSDAISPEVIAAISAAIAQFEGPAAPRLVIRSVRRSTQWNGGRR
ncbi:MAG: OadG family protein [Clostridia bacterium]|nr:OadG family protein [Clostridia bacterium]